MCWDYSLRVLTHTLCCYTLGWIYRTRSLASGRVCGFEGGMGLWLCESADTVAVNCLESRMAIPNFVLSMKHLEKSLIEYMINIQSFLGGDFINEHLLLVKYIFNVPMRLLCRAFTSDYVTYLLWWKNEKRCLGWTDRMPPGFLYVCVTID